MTLAGGRLMLKWFREASPRLKARIAGVFYLASFVFGIVGEQFVRGRLGFAMGIIAVSCNASMTLVIYDILKSVNKNLSLFAASLNCVGLVFEVLRWNPLGVDMAMVLHGFYCLAIGYIVFNSRFLPRILGALMALAGLVWLIYLSPPLAKHLFPYNVAAGLLGEVSLMLWLLIMGVNVQRWNERAGLSTTF
jgi:hypothetical protein